MTAIIADDRRSGHYDKEDEFIRVSLPETRRGVLTHASILTLTSNPAETSPVKRGKWILDNILGTPPPPAPPGVPAFDAAKKAKPDATLRQQLELHRSHPRLCELSRRDGPAGTGFRTFRCDRAMARRKMASSMSMHQVSLRMDRSFNGATELIGLLKSREQQIARHFVEKLMTFALGRGLEPYDQCAVDQVMAAAEKDDFRVSAIVNAIVVSDPFQKRRQQGTQP